MEKADKLIRAGDLFKAVCEDTSIRGSAFAAIRRHINAAPAVAQWIPFTDPPKRLKTVICLYTDENGTQVGGGYVNDHGIWTLIAPAKGTITHWMPLPEHPATTPQSACTADSSPDKGSRGSARKEG